MLPVMHVEPTDLAAALRRYFVKRVGVSEADDLVQEVLLRLQSRKSDHDIAHMQSYVFTVAANVLREGRRRGARSPFVDAEIEDIDSITPERIVAGRREMELVQQAIASLPERTREIFVAHRFEEMTYGSIATLFGISTSSVEKHIMSALKALTRALKGAVQ